MLVLISVADVELRGGVAAWPLRSKGTGCALSVPHAPPSLRRSRGDPVKVVVRGAGIGLVSFGFVPTPSTVHKSPCHRRL
jgi:hypothetical protein